MYDLRKFTLRDMTELGSVLRRIGTGASTMEEVADRIVRYLCDHLVDGETGATCCALVRFFKTHPYGALDEDLRQFAREMLHGREATPHMKCLTLLATAGQRPEWNSRRASAAHRAIPLASEKLVSNAPMISSLLGQLGVEVGVLLDADRELLVESEPSSFNVFYVPDARGSPYIPAQRDFVEPVGVGSVLGFGGMLPRGDIFAVVLFLTTRVPRETAELFRTLALSVKTAALPFDEAVFAAPPESQGVDRDRSAAELRRLRERIATLEQLLEVYEDSVLEQSDRLYAEQERMRFQKSLLECQGEASPDGVMSVSVDGTILFANGRLAEMWGVPQPRVGTKSYEWVLRSLAERTMDPTEFLDRSADLENGEHSRQEVSLDDGRTFDRYTAPIQGPEGRILGRVWHFRDISTTKEIARMKNEFISSVSHEFRTPLTSIRGSLDLMLSGVSGTLPPEAMDLAKVAQGNCTRLVRLINDVLDIEKIEAGRMEFRLELLELEPLLERSVELMASYGERLGVGFRIETSAPGARARVDAERLIQVVENLLSNAAKFSPSGGTVRLLLARSGDRIRVSVVDSGPGISREFQGRVFEKFTQGPPSDAHRTGGTGLGLHIARRIVEQLGGTIDFESRPGAGTTFRFELPEWHASEDGEAAT
ncbi:MAG: ATP-binding protein [Myxococcota bacterium]